MLSTKRIGRRGAAFLQTAAVLFLAGSGQAQIRAPKTFGDDYAGSTTCQMCHEDNFNIIQKSPHSVIDSDVKRGFKDHVCESCHGPGARHAASGDASLIRNPSKLTAGETDRICLNCHLNQPTHAGRIQNTHARDSISCTACHKVHANGPNGLVARKAADVNALCESCHLNVKAMFDKPYGHKVPQNAMTCVDCHNPHGTVRPALTRTFAGNEPGCLKCHGDKRGPFSFEHAPVKFDGCTACHEPHGSANPRMLVRTEVRQVCLECHANMPNLTQQTRNTAMGVVPPAIHDLLSPRYQNCTVCHQKVHGSYVDRFLLR